MKMRALFIALTTCFQLLGCGGSDAAKATLTFPQAGDVQTPPTTGSPSDMKSWLDAGHYKGWQCELEAHPAKGPSMHGMNRGCSNDLVSSFTAGAGERPAGSAAVKEFWNEEGKVYGRAAYVKTAAQSAGGESWFWYVEIDGKGVLANGHPSQDAAAKAACAACHVGAGSDAQHTTSAGSGDFVYTQVER